MDAQPSSTPSPRAGRCPQAGTGTTQCSRESARRSSHARGSTRVGSSSCRNRRATSPRRSATCPSSSSAREGESARFRQRLPPSRPHPGERRGLPRDAAVPLPRLDVRARRVASARAAGRAGAGVRRVDVLAPAGRGRHLGPVRLRQPGCRGGPTRGRARRAARSRSRLRGSTSPASRFHSHYELARSRPTGRWCSRTSSSATTARPRIPASAR